MDDDRIRASAQRFRDEVAASVDVELAHQQSRRGRDRPRSGAVAAVLAALALVAGALILRPQSGEVEVAIDEETTTTTSTTIAPEPTVPDDGQVPAPIAIGAPDDGKDSVGLPVTAEPSTGLTDGQTVMVTGSGFPPGVAVGVVMCAKEAGADHGGRGVDACNIGHFSQGDTDQDGNVSIDFSVRRLLVVDGEEIDCASEPGRCILGMGMLSDYDQSGGVAVDFDPDEPLPEPPAITLSKYDGIADGEEVRVRVSGLLPDSHIAFLECTSDGHCAELGRETADSAGSFTGDVRLWRNLGVPAGAGADRPPNVDCAVERCTVTIRAQAPRGRRAAPVPISFDPALGGRVPPTFELAASGPFSYGDTVELLVEHLPGGVGIGGVVCPDGDFSLQGCSTYSEVEYDGGGTLNLPIQAPPGSSACSEGCVLVLNGHDYDLTGGVGSRPPLLVPEPIPIPIAP